MAHMPIPSQKQSPIAADSRSLAEVEPHLTQHGVGHRALVGDQQQQVERVGAVARAFVADAVGRQQHALDRAVPEMLSQKLVTQRGVSVAQGAKDLDVHENVLRKWVRESCARRRKMRFLVWAGKRCRTLK